MGIPKLKTVLNAKNTALLVLLAAIIIFFSIAARVAGLGTFFSVSNTKTILNSMVIVAFLTIGAGCLIISGNLDLSAGYVGTLCGVMVAYFSSNVGMPWALSLICAVIAGMVFGLFNAFLVNELNLQAFIATLATGYIAEGISYILFMNSSGLAALSGILLSARMHSGTIQGIKFSNFSGVTAAILGGISFGGGSGGMGGAFMGLLIINSFNNGMSIMQIPSYYQSIASGLLLILALTLDFFASARERRIKET